MPDIAASVLAKLKNKAKALGISYQQCLQLFFQEEFLRKLALSPYVENLVLKGGIFTLILYSTTIGRFLSRVLCPFPSRKEWAAFISTYLAMISSNVDAEIF